MSWIWQLGIFREFFLFKKIYSLMGSAKEWWYSDPHKMIQLLTVTFTNMRTLFLTCGFVR